MKTSLDEIQQSLISIIKSHTPPLKVRIDKPEQLEVAGTKETMQGKQKVEGMYFASIIPKPKDIRLYFFPIYMNPDAFTLSDSLKKCLKGKSCFHFKKLDADLEKEIGVMIEKGVALFQQQQLI